MGITARADLRSGFDGFMDVGMAGDGTRLDTSRNGAKGSVALRDLDLERSGAEVGRPSSRSGRGSALES